MQLYTGKLEIQVEGINNDLIIEKNKETIALSSKNNDSTGLNIWVEGITAGDLINNFSMEEILDAMDFSDVVSYVEKRTDE